MIKIPKKKKTEKKTLGLNLNKELEDIYTENYKTLTKI